MNNQYKEHGGFRTFVNDLIRAFSKRMETVQRNGILRSFNWEDPRFLWRRCCKSQCRLCARVMTPITVTDLAFPNRALKMIPSQRGGSTASYRSEGRFQGDVRLRKLAAVFDSRCHFITYLNADRSSSVVHGSIEKPNTAIESFWRVLSELSITFWRIPPSS